jgi:hypothetical protein
MTFFGLLVLQHVTSQAAYVTGIYLTVTNCTIQPFGYCQRLKKEEYTAFHLHFRFIRATQRAHNNELLLYGNLDQLKSCFVFRKYRI